MERLFNFVYEYRAFFTFLMLEVFCAWMIIENNQYQSTKFFNSSSKASAGILSVSHGLTEYFSLRRINEELADENTLLRKKLEQRNQSLYSLETHEIKDPAIINRYDYISAKVVNNSTAQSKNFITIDRGADAGIEPGMAVICSGNVIGKVKYVSSHFSVVISLLNTDEQVSSIIKRTGYFGTIQWDGIDPRLIKLLYIPRHVNALVGDTVVTSGYNAIFPAGTMIGIIKEVNQEEALWYDIKVEMVQEFGNLTFVKVVKSNLKNERDFLENKTVAK
jgi:rod shape-determining protein MreC